MPGDLVLQRRAYARLVLVDTTLRPRLVLLATCALQGHTVSQAFLLARIVLLDFTTPFPLRPPASFVPLGECRRPRRLRAWIALLVRAIPWRGARPALFATQDISLALGSPRAPLAWADTILRLLAAFLARLACRAHTAQARQQDARLVPSDTTVRRKPRLRASSVLLGSTARSSAACHAPSATLENSTKSLAAALALRAAKVLIAASAFLLASIALLESEVLAVRSHAATASPELTAQPRPAFACFALEVILRLRLGQLLARRV
jgi:hypothetical protein